MTKAAALHDSSNDSDSDGNSRLRQWRGLLLGTKLYTKLEHISYANWQMAMLPRSSDPPPPPPPPPPSFNALLYMVLYSMIELAHRSMERPLTCSARGFGEARVRPCWRLSRSKHLHQYTSLYKCLILIFKRYGVNKHNLLTTSYFFDESGCEYSWINWLSEKIKSFKTIVVFMVSNLNCCDP